MAGNQPPTAAAPGVEIVGDLDGDFDGVVNELTVGDMTALAVYMAALERPVSTLELAELGLMEVDAQERQAIIDGERVFADIGCAACHTPTMLIEDTVFREPSSTPGFFDVAFPDGSDPAQHELTGQASIAFDLTRDQPKNQIPTADGEIHLLGALPQDAAGRGIARWFTDLKRHDMGQTLADPSDPLDIGASMFLTRSLAGVGSTGPWLHDGRATTLHDAILAHGGEAEESRDGYVALDDEEVRKIIAFLESLVIYDNPIPFDED